MHNSTLPLTSVRTNRFQSVSVLTPEILAFWHSGEFLYILYSKLLPQKMIMIVIVSKNGTLIHKVLSSIKWIIYVLIIYFNVMHLFLCYIKKKKKSWTMTWHSKHKV